MGGASNYKPHTHIMCTNAGIDEAGNWVEIKSSRFFLAVKCEINFPSS